jgi:hypothetical protein
METERSHAYLGSVFFPVRISQAAVPAKGFSLKTGVVFEKGFAFMLVKWPIYCFY